MLKKILLGGLAALVAAVCLFYFTLIAPTYAPAENCAYRLDLAELRTLAVSMPGEKPKEIRVEHVTSADFPKAVACPGQSWDGVQFQVYAYQLVYADRTILVDTTMNLPQAETIGMTDGYDDAAWQRVTKAMREASAIYVTHEHVDHMGGAFADDTWASKVHLNGQQLDSTVRNRPEISDKARAAVQRLRDERVQAVAPGVVLIAAYGHTPGSQMVYVNRADGAEMIFTGDTAWLVDNIDHEQGPVKLAGLMMGGDRAANSCQLAALKKVATAEPTVGIMPGHDKARMTELLGRGLLVKGFQ